MKINKIILAALLVSVLSSTCQAQFHSMLFKTTEGEEYLIPIENLSIKFTETEMIAKQDQKTLTLPLAKLESMQFTEDEAGIENLLIGAENPVEVFDLKGRNHGLYKSLAAIRSALSEGIYIIKQKNGETVKYYLTK